MKFYIGIDVGSTSVRGGIFDINGNLITQAKKDINQWNPQPMVYEQSSDDIWDSVISIIKRLTNALSHEDVIDGLAFDATCSLVVIDKISLEPKSVSLTGDGNKQNIIMWMDHRATKEAEIINQGNHRLLQYVGKSISVEMEPPKLMWLKENFGDKYLRENYFFDLADFLTFKATGNMTRSLNTITCKWMFDGVSGSWDASFWHSIGLKSLIENNFESIGQSFASPGTNIEPGLSEKAAKEMGLRTGCHVAVSMIDAYAGALSSSFCNGGCDELSGRLALIAGTSACQITNIETSIFSPGVWGPYLSVTLPNLWTLEAGQSAAGSLINHVQSLFSCPSTTEEITAVLEEIRIEKKLENIAFITKDVHILPDFHGNRSPLADHSMRGMIAGLQLDRSEKAGCVLYLATMQALAYGTRHIVESLMESGHPEIKCIYLSGGLRHNTLYVQTHSDVLGRPILMPKTEESMLLGAAMLAKASADRSRLLAEVAAEMAGDGYLWLSNTSVTRYHQKKYEAYQQLINCQKLCKQLMNS